MGFEFNNTPPAWLSDGKLQPFMASSTSTDAPDSTKSAFSPSSNTDTPTMAQSAASRGSFGGISSFTSSASSLGRSGAFAAPNPSFGATPVLGQKKWLTLNSTPSSSSPSTFPTPSSSSDHTGTATKKPDDPLSQALQRASQGQPAGFGGAVADSLLKEVLKEARLNTSSAATLMQSLRNNPQLATFTQKLFGKMVDSRAPKMKSSPSPNAQGVDNIFMRPEKRKKEADSEPGYPPRDHWACLAFEEKLAVRLVEEGVMLRADEAKVLVVYMHTELRKAYKHISRCAEDVTSIVKRPDATATIRSLLRWAEQKIERSKMAFGDPRPKDNTAVEKARDDFLTGLPTAAAERAEPHPIYTDANFTPFRFLDLPAELRNWVYRELLVTESGYLSDHRLRDTIGSNGVKFANHYSGLDTKILRTCKQIHKEAKSILYGNNTIVAEVDARVGTGGRVLHMCRLKGKMWPEITNLVLVVDTSSSGGPFKGDAPNYLKMNWYALQSLTGLKNLRICNVERPDQPRKFGEEHLEHKTAFLEQIIERIPAGCTLNYGLQEGFLKKYVRECIEAGNTEKNRIYYRLQDAYEFDGETLKKCAESVLPKQGVKSGDQRDYYFADRSMKLGSLVKDGEEKGDVDPGYMLGGSGA